MYSCSSTLVFYIDWHFSPGHMSMDLSSVLAALSSHGVPSVTEDTEDKGAGWQSKHRKGQAELAARQAFPADRWLPASRQRQQMGRKYTFIVWYRAGAPHSHRSNDSAAYTGAYLRHGVFWGCSLCFRCGSPLYLMCPDTTRHAAAPSTAYTAPVGTFRTLFAMGLPFLH